MFNYKPTTAAAYDNSLEKVVGWGDFEPFEPDSKYSWKNRPAPHKDSWPIAVPKGGPPVRQNHLPFLIREVIKASWKFAEPAHGTPRGNLSIGVRGGLGAVPTDTYHSQVRPTSPVINTTFLNENAIASDWKVFEQIPRTNAVTFRGDSRNPMTVIKECDGFGPPDSRTDAWYLEHNIYDAFKDYLKRRYGRDLPEEAFLQAIRTAVPTAEDQRLLVDYMMWRKICEKEALHMGRMVENECLKGYISTSRSIDTAIMFGSRYYKVPGWVYVTFVHGGFVVPWGKENLWGSEEAEIAQWGPVPGKRIVGFMQIDFYNPTPGTPIYFRPSFRKEEPQAFEYIFKVMSGKTP